MFRNIYKYGYLYAHIKPKTKIVLEKMYKYGFLYMHVHEDMCIYINI